MALLGFTASAHLVKLIDQATPVQQLDGGLEAEDGAGLQALLLLLGHQALPLT